MKKNNYRYLALLPALLLLSCTREATDDGGVRSIGQVRAEVKEMPQTKAHLEEGSHIIWDLSDQIGVFSDMEPAQAFTKTEDDNTFVGSDLVRGHAFYAFYPYSASAYDAANPAVVHLNSAVTASGTNPVLNVPMVASAADADFSFTQTCGVIHFTIEGTKTLSAVTLRGNLEEPFAGAGTVSLEEETPVFRLDEGGAVSVTHRFPTLVNLNDGPVDVYFVVPPMTFQEGISIDLAYENGMVAQVTKTTANPVEVKRAIIKNFKAVEVDKLVDEAEEILRKERNALIALYNNTGGKNWSKKDNWRSSRPLSEWYGVEVDEDGRVVSLNLPQNNLTGEIPDQLYDLTALWRLSLWGNNLTGSLSPKVGQLKDLLILWMDNNSLSGPLPAELADCESLILCDLYYNQFSGEIPESFRYWVPWVYSYGSIVFGNEDEETGKPLLDWSTCRPIVPPFNVTLTNGETCDYNFLADNQYTILFEGSTSPDAAYTQYMMPYMNKVYDYCKDKGVDVLAWFFQEKDTDPTAAEFAKTHNANYKVFQPSDDNTMTYSYWSNCYPFTLFTQNHIPTVSVFDNTGQLVWSNIDYVSPYPIVEVMEYLLDETIPTPDTYNSTDYSADGTVHVIQTASEGAGIDLVLMGDGYSDRQIASGKYMEDMTLSIENYFSLEPYKSCRNLFNVYVVDVVSQNEGYEVPAGVTALGGYFAGGGDTLVGGDDDAIQYYSWLALGQNEDRLSEAVMVCIMNQDYYAGTCYMYSVNFDNDYGAGPAVAYFPAYYTQPDIFAAMISHEAGGHGFGKLADEYVYSGTIPQSGGQNGEDVQTYRYLQQHRGWCKNVDFTNKASSVLWHRFLEDERYDDTSVDQKLGVFQGGCTFKNGVWRPTYNGMMNENIGGYNAPSREAIWHRIQTLAYGSAYQYSYETFTAWDLAHKQHLLAPAAAPAGRGVKQALPPLAHPVVRPWNGLSEATITDVQRKIAERKASVLTPEMRMAVPEKHSLVNKKKDVSLPDEPVKLPVWHK